MSRPLDHANRDLWSLNEDVAFGRSGGEIIWQPRIGCWYDDRVYRGEPLPGRYAGLDMAGLYAALGCSNRLYEYNRCFKRVYHPGVRRSHRKIGEYEYETVYDTPKGRLVQLERGNSGNGGRYPYKWLAETEEDLKILTWIEDTTDWVWDGEAFSAVSAVWGRRGAPVIYMPRINIQEMFVTTMGVEGGVYALQDCPRTVEKYFDALNRNHMRMIEVINQSPIRLVNFGDNVHGGVLPPDLFKKYALPAYLERNERLHAAGKFTFSHWDGDVKPLLPFARQCGFDGIEAVTPLPQGDVTLREVKEAFGDELFLIDGVAALLFEDSYPLEQLERQVKECIELFAPRLILGISDEISSRGDIDRVVFVRDIVDEYNAKMRGEE